MSDASKNILIVDDDPGLRELLSAFLRKNMFQTFTAENGNAMKAVLAKEKVDFSIVAIMLPGDDGLMLCRELRAKSNIPILMLTAVTEEVDRIIGLEMGADDYLPKPFHPRELLARIKAILRRTDNQMLQKKNPPVYHFCGWQLNTGTRQLTTPDQLGVSLTDGEYSLLLAFLERPQTVLSRDALSTLTKNRMTGPFDRGIDIQLSRLRRKIEDDPKNPVILKTVRGDGYFFSTPVTVNDER